MIMKKLTTTLLFFVLVQMLPAQQIMLENPINGIICGSGTVNLLVNGVIPNEPTFAWTVVLPDQTSSVINENDDSVSFDVSMVGEYKFMVEITSASSSDIINLEKSVTVAENPSITLQPRDALCFESADGSIEISVSSGKAPYSYQITGQSSPVQVVGSQGVASGLTRGIYSLVLTDDNNCTTTGTAEVRSPDMLNADFSVEDIKCYGENTGVIKVTVSGGTAPYVIKLKDNVSNDTYPLSDVQENSESKFDMLRAGSFSVTITDSQNCTLNNDNLELNQQLQITYSSQIVNVKCNGGNDGSITISGVAGGSAPYHYSWGGVLTTNSIQGLAAGTYTVTITDANACENTARFDVTEPDSLKMTVTSVFQPEKCGDSGSVSLEILGGVPPFIFTISNNGSLVTYTLPMNSSISSSLYTGRNVLSLKDQNQCKADTLSIEIMKPESPELSNLQTMESKCNLATGSAEIFVSGDSYPITIWLKNNQTGDTLRTKIINAEGNSVLDGLVSGSYCLFAMDTKKCADTLSQVVEINNFTSPVIGGVVKKDPYCGENDGSISVPYNVNYDYQWDNMSSSSEIKDLQAGSYMLTVTDNTTNCKDTVQIVLTWKNSISDLFDIMNPSPVCQDDAATLTVLRADGGLLNQLWTYKWSLTAMPAVSLSTKEIYQPATDVHGDYGYTVTVTIDNPGVCKVSSTKMVNLRVKERPKPVGGSYGYCLGDIIKLDGFTTGNPPVGTTFSWSAYPTLSFLSINRVFYVNDTLIKQYKLDATNEGCLASVIFDVQPLGVWPPPGKDIVLKSPGRNNILVYPQSDLCYQWGYIENQVKKPVISQTLQYFYLGANFVQGREYYVDVKLPDRCDESCARTVTRSFDAFETVPEDFNITVAPNPNDGNFDVLISQPAPEDLQLAIYSITGRMVQFTTSGLYTLANVNFNLTQEPSGIYFLHISDSSGKIVNRTKLVVIH